MHKETKWFELVVHIDEDGTRATASKRTRTFEDDGTIDHAATKMESCTLAQLGADFPWKEFADAALQGALLTIEKHEATISAKEEEKTAALAAKDAELAAQAAENAAKDLELAAEREVTIAAISLAAKTVEVAAVEKDDPDREKKEAEAMQFAVQVEAKIDELIELKMPEEEKRRAGIQAEIDQLQASLEPGAGKGEG